MPFLDEVDIPEEDDNDEDDETEYCQDCGCIIEWGMKGSGDDFVRPGYVTASGDVFCRRCGREYDEEEERRAEEEQDYYPDPMEEIENCIWEEEE